MKRIISRALLTSMTFIAPLAASGAAQQGGVVQNPQQQTASEKESGIRLRDVPPSDLIIIGDYSSAILGKAAQLGFIGTVVKGSPYSAQGVTKVSSVLTDGTHIDRTIRYTICRDNEGRMRREDEQGIWISDPIAGITYLLDPIGQTVRKMPLARLLAGAKMNAARVAAATGTEGPRPSTDLEARAAAKMNSSAPGARGTADARARTVGDGSEPSGLEALGRQVVEGLDADGSRTSTIIPTGQIGNDRPIQIIFERWYSPELQVVVMTHTLDPRSGEISFHLTNIRRAEPDHSLFVVPAGYRVVPTN